jgi:hypothetical protein
LDNGKKSTCLELEEKYILIQVENLPYEPTEEGRKWVPEIPPGYHWGRLTSGRKCLPVTPTVRNESRAVARMDWGGGGGDKRHGHRGNAGAGGGVQSFLLENSLLDCSNNAP